MRLPSPVIERHGDFYVCRDDLLDGGTKRRALINYLPVFNSAHFFYAGTIFGSGGWALAEACNDLELDCTLLLASNDYRPQWTDKFSKQIEWHAPITVAALYDICRLKAAETGGIALPLGFDDPIFKNSMVKTLKETDVNPSEIWMSCVSGTLVNAAQAAWQAKPMNAVCVAKNHGELGTAKKYQAAEKYHQFSRDIPPYPSNIFSDAKIWSFARQFALKDALIWNTSA